MVFTRWGLRAVRVPVTTLPARGPCAFLGCCAPCLTRSHAHTHALPRLPQIMKNPVYYRCTDGELIGDYHGAVTHQRGLPRTAGAEEVEGVPVSSPPLVRLQAYDVWVPVRAFEGRDPQRGRYQKVCGGGGA